MKKKILIIIIMGTGLFCQAVHGQTWSETKRLTWNSSGSFNPSIATDSNDNVYVVWTDYATGNAEIYLKKSTNGGTIWTSQRLTWNSGISMIPNIAIDTADRIHIVWQDDSSGSYELLYKKSTNGGTSWTSKKVTANSGGCGASSPVIATDTNNHIHIVWYNDESGNFEIYYTKSTNGGNTWTNKRLTWNPLASRSPAITTDSYNRIYVVWYDDSPGNSEIYLKKSTNGGNSWTTKRLTWNNEASLYPSISADSNDFIHVVWDNGASGNKEIFYKKTTNGGTSWTSTRLTWNAGDSEWAEVSIDANNNIHVVWDDETTPNEEIFYKRSTNGGGSWTMKRITWNTGPSEFPKITCDTTNSIYVIWHDNTPGNREILYRKGIQ